MRMKDKSLPKRGIISSFWKTFVLREGAVDISGCRKLTRMGQREHSRDENCN